MAPEQARGKPVDKRADIWAFGVVLYEMLTGERAFAGDDVSDVLAAVLRQEIDWTKLPAATPPRVRELLSRCLAKDVKERLQAIGEARVALTRANEPIGSSGAMRAAGLPEAKRGGPGRVWPWAIAALALVGWAATAVVLTRRAPAGASELRTSLAMPDGLGIPTLYYFGNGSTAILSVSPLGDQVAFVGVQDGSRSGLPPSIRQLRRRPRREHRRGGGAVLLARRQGARLLRARVPLAHRPAGRRSREDRGGGRELGGRKLGGRRPDRLHAGLRRPALGRSRGRRRAPRADEGRSRRGRDQPQVALRPPRRRRRAVHDQAGDQREPGRRPDRDRRRQDRCAPRARRGRQHAAIPRQRPPRVRTRGKALRRRVRSQIGHDSRRAGPGARRRRHGADDGSGVVRRHPRRGLLVYATGGRVTQVGSFSWEGPGRPTQVSRTPGRGCVRQRDPSLARFQAGGRSGRRRQRQALADRPGADERDQADLRRRQRQLRGRVTRRPLGPVHVGSRGGRLPLLPHAARRRADRWSR